MSLCVALAFTNRQVQVLLLNLSSWLPSAEKPRISPSKTLLSSSLVCLGHRQASSKNLPQLQYARR